MSRPQSLWSVELLCLLCGSVIGCACRFWLAAFVVSVSGCILLTMTSDCKRYNGDSVLPAVIKSVRARTFFSSGSGFRSHPGFLTMRAPDKWDSARFSSLVQASSFFRSSTESTLPPLAGNAGRWATKCKICSPSHVITKSLELSREA